MDAVTLALLKALGGGSGGSGLPSTDSASAGDVLTLNNSKDPQWATPSGSGGGVLVVHATFGDAEITLDKTWQEIYDADYAVVHLNFTGRSYGQLINIDNDGEEYTVSFATISTTPTTDVLTFTASSANGYPVYRE